MTSRYAITRDVSTREINGGNIYAMMNRELIPLVRSLRARANAGEVPAGGLTVDLDYSVLDVLSDLESSSVLVSSNYNVLKVLSSSSSTEPEVTVTGDGNVITLQTPSKSLVVAGDNNTFAGNVLSVTDSGYNNDFSQLAGGRGRGLRSGTTDGSGQLSIPIAAVTGLSVAPVVSLLGAVPADGYVRVVSASSSAIVVEVRKDDGTAYAATAVSVSYVYECY